MDKREWGARFGAQIKARREALGLSTAEAAQKAGVSRQAWREWESGTVPLAIWLVPIGQALGIRPAKLLTQKGES